MALDLNRVEALFSAALQHGGADRAEFLSSACAGDGALRTRVEALLGAHAAAQQFLERPAVEQFAPAAPAPPDPTLFFVAPADGDRNGPAVTSAETPDTPEEDVLTFLGPSEQPGS